MSKTPIWKSIALSLTADIAEGRYRAGDRLPTEAQLSATHGVNRHTVRRALSEYAATQLAADHRYAIVPTSEIRRALRREKAESFAQCYDEACQIELGKEVAANLALSMTLTRIGRTCVTSMRLYDLRTASTLRAAAERDIKSIAERVENANAMAVLFQLGLDYMQGHYVNEPEVVLQDTENRKRLSLDELAAANSN